MPKQSHTSSARHIIHLLHDCFCAQTNRTPLRRAQSPTLCTIASVSEQSHTFYVRHNTHLIHDHLRAQTIAHLFGAPYHPPNARSLACPNSQVTYLVRHITHPMHDHFSAHTIARLFGAPCRSPNARPLLYPYNRTPLRHDQSPTFTLALPSQSPRQCTISSVPNTIAHLFGAPYRPATPQPLLCPIPLSHTLFARPSLRCYLCNPPIPGWTFHSLFTLSVH